MPLNLRPQTGWRSSFSPVSQNRVNQYRGVHADRRTRFDARSARRWGDWSLLEFPTAMLWLDSELLAAEVADESLQEPWDDLWP